MSVEPLSPSVTLAGPVRRSLKSSSVIVPVKVFMLAVWNVAFVRLLRDTTTVSGSSVSVSPCTSTVIVPVVCPAAMVTTPAVNAV